MDLFGTEYLAFFSRLLHVLSGVMWIGLLWYFNFVQIPSMPNIPDDQKPAISKVIAPKAKYEIVGIRPGEKIHEEMITETDSLNTVEFKDYFVILPVTLKEFWDLEQFRLESGESVGEYCEYGFSYNSGTNPVFLSLDELKNLIET